MPYHVARSDQCSSAKPWAVIMTASGKVMGCHPDEQSAKEQLAALYANEADKSTMVTRAYSTLIVKSVNEKERIIEGIASTPSTDRVGDIVESMGARFNLPLPFLWQHNAEEPIGHVVFAKPTKDGIPFRAKIARSGVADFIDRAWALIKEGLVRGASIGFKPIESESVTKDDGPNGPRRYKVWDWLELSAVTIPANSEASIQTIKSYDDHYLRAAHGQPTQSDVVVRLNSPGASGKSAVSKLKGNTMKTIKEQLDAVEAKRKAAFDRMTAIMQKAAEEEVTLDAAQQEEYDELEGEVGALDKHIERLKRHEKMLVTTATEVTSAAGTDPNAAARVRHGEAVFRSNSNLPKGTAFVRYCMLMAASKGNVMLAAERAKQFDTSTPEVGAAFQAAIGNPNWQQKAAVAAGTTTETNWALPLVPTTPMSSEFIEYLYPMTIVGRLPGLRRVPFNISMPRQTSGASNSKWVGQGLAKPVSKLQFETISLGFAKIATIIVLTEELVRFSNPAAEAVCRQDLAEAITKYMDEQFIDPNVAAVTNVSPASVTYAATKTNASGTTIASVMTDVAAMFNQFSTNNIDPTGAVWVMNPRTAQSIMMLQTSLGQPAFPGISISGGTFFGLPVVTSNSVKIAAASENETIAVLMKPSEILLADDGAVNVDISNEASIEMDSAPSTGETSVMVSMFQNNMVALRAERMINWRLRRDAAVQVWDGVRL